MTLPIEIMSVVCANLGHSDLCNFRLASKEFAYAGKPKALRSVHIHHNENSFAPLRDSAAHTELGPYLETITFRPCRIRPRDSKEWFHRVSFDWYAHNCDCPFFRIDDAWLRDDDLVRLCLEEDWRRTSPHHLESGMKAAFKEELRSLWSLGSDISAFQKSNPPARIFAKHLPDMIRACHKLSELIIACSDIVQTRCLHGECTKIHSRGLICDKDMALDVFSSAVQAFLGCKQPLLSLTLTFCLYENAVAQRFHVFNHFHGSDWIKLSSTLELVVCNLTCLRLALPARKNRPDEMSVETDLVNILRQAVHLQELRLGLVKHIQRDALWYGQLQLSKLSAMSIPQLTRLQLCGFQGAEGDIVQLLLNHGATLEHVTFKGGLTHPFNFNPTSIPGLQLSFSWETFFNSLAGGLPRLRRMIFADMLPTGPHELNNNHIANERGMEAFKQHSACIDHSAAIIDGRRKWILYRDTTVDDHAALCEQADRSFKGGEFDLDPADPAYEFDHLFVDSWEHKKEGACSRPGTVGGSKFVDLK